MTNISEKIYFDNIEDAIERNRKKIPEVKKYLIENNVKYIMSSWIDLHGIPKTKPVPISDFENLCLELDIVVEEKKILNSKGKVNTKFSGWSNLLSSSVIYRLSR